MKIDEKENRNKKRKEIKSIIFNSDSLVSSIG